MRLYQGARSQCYRLYKYSSFWGVRALQIALSPIVLIRIDTMRAGRIGHLISETEQVLGQLTLNPNPVHRRIKNYITVPKFVCNDFLMEKYIELLERMPDTRVLSSKFHGRFSPVALAGTETRRRVFKGAESVRWYCGPRTNGGQFMANEPLSLKPFLSLPVEVTAEGWRILEGTGFTTERPLVCLHIRDGAYLLESHPKAGDWSYHDYRDPQIEGYEELVRYLLDEGYSVVRTGSVTDKRMSIEDPNFLDYPFSSVKSDWMDVFLYSVCDFAIAGSLSGIDLLATLMRKPVAICDLRPLYLPSYKRDLSVFIFSRLRWRNSGIDLTLRETLNNLHSMTSDFDDAGIEILPNSAQELIDVAQELISLRAGELENSDADSVNEESFWRIFGEQNQALEITASGPEFFPRIGMGFLQRHAEALALR